MSLAVVTNLRTLLQMADLTPKERKIITKKIEQLEKESIEIGKRVEAFRTDSGRLTAELRKRIRTEVLLEETAKEVNEVAMRMKPYEKSFRGTRTEYPDQGTSSASGAWAGSFNQGNFMPHPVTPQKHLELRTSSASGAWAGSFNQANIRTKSPRSVTGEETNNGAYILAELDGDMDQLAWILQCFQL